MPTTIITKNGSGEPSADKLTAGELAVDLTNKRLYTKDTSGNILELGTNPGPDFPFPDQNGLTISDVAPLDPNEGDQWLNSDTAEVFIYDGAVWLEFPQGADGAPGQNGQNGADGKQIWSEVTEDGDIYYDKGNVGIGTSDPSSSAVGPAKLVVQGNNSALNIASEGNNSFLYMGKAGTTTADGSVAYYNNLKEMRFSTDGTERLSIDATGDAEFTGSINSKNLVYINPTDQGDDSGFIRIRGGTGSWFNIGKNQTTNSLEINSGASFESPANGGLSIGSTGDATFTGSVVSTRSDWQPAGVDANSLGMVNAQFFSHDGGGAGIYLTSSNAQRAVLPTSGAAPSNNAVDLGSTTRRWRNVYGASARMDKVIQDGAPVIDARGLIKTLSTLRNATKDETTLEGLRDALSDAIGGLIEDFENQISTMPAEDES